MQRRNLKALRPRLISVGSIAALVCGLLLAPGGVSTAIADPAPPDAGTPATVTADALPTVQINGVVWTQVIVGNTVYVGGSFTAARPAGSPAGTNETPRSNLLAYNLQTGDLITTFDLPANGQVMNLVVSPDGSTVYAGGDFTSINGVKRNRVAAIDVASGQLKNWAPNSDARVAGIAVIGDIVYLGGSFSKINGVARGKLAAVDTAGVLRDWAPIANTRVLDLVATPAGDKIIAAGGFLTLNGAIANGQGALDPATGASLPWVANTVIKNYGTSASIYSLSADEDTVYGTGYWYGGTGNYEGVFALDPADGSIKWLADCHGDTYSALSMGEVVYAVSHHHTCDNIPSGFPEQSPRTWKRADAFSKAATGTVEPNNQGNYGNFAGFPAPSQLHWYPDLNSGTFTGQDQGAWTLDGNGEYLVAGGEFTTVNVTQQQGLVRFAVKEIAPRKQGARIFSSEFVPTATVVNGQVRLNWTSNFDRDSELLTYKLVRDANSAAPIAEFSARSSWWKRPVLSAYDVTAVPGQTYSYRIWVQDSDGNLIKGDPLVYTVPTTQSAATYVQSVQQDLPSNFWRLSETTGSVAADWMGAMNATARGTYSRNQAGALFGQTDKAMTLSSLSGTTYRNGWVSSNTVGVAPQTFTAEAWFKTSTTNGGQILGFGNAVNANSTLNDRTIYMDDSGKLYFGVNSGGPVTISSPNSYNNGAWHHVVATLGADGMKLYVDGALVADRAETTNALQFNGYWRIGGDILTAWPGVTTQDYFLGQVDEVAIYRYPLAASRIELHHAVGLTGQIPNALPTASFTADQAGMDLALDASASSDSDGTIANYSWQFGDGATGTGVTADHTYAAPGTYDVQLTVTDNLGGTHTTSQSVRFNAAPVASFTIGAEFLVLNVDGAATTDLDGTVSSYSWDFGDGTSASGVTAQHTYQLPGSYTVSLLATDNDGATHLATQQVTVEADPTINLPPVAVFSTAPNSLTVDFDGSASTDADGAIVGYVWDFGDGSATATGVTTSHLYGTEGTFDVSLTVTDDDGASHVSTQQVVVTETMLVRDAFERAVASGWGTADVGGSWTTTGTASHYSVAGGSGKITIPAIGLTREARLAAISSSASDLEVKISLEAAASGNGLYASVVGRRVGTNNDYRLKVRFQPSGVLLASLVRTVGGVETTLTTATVAGISYVTGQQISVRFQVTGTGTSDLKAKVWASGQTEPGAWLLSASDSTAALQAAGSVALAVYVPSNATVLPMVVALDDLKVRPVA